MAQLQIFELVELEFPSHPPYFVCRPGYIHRTITIPDFSRYGTINIIIEEERHPSVLEGPTGNITPIFD